MFFLEQQLTPANYRCDVKLTYESHPKLTVAVQPMRSGVGTTENVNKWAGIHTCASHRARAHIMCVCVWNLSLSLSLSLSVCVCVCVCAALQRGGVDYVAGGVLDQR